jgi:hypothetical protein
MPCWAHALADNPANAATAKANCDNFMADLSDCRTSHPIDMLASRLKCD